MHHYCTLFPVGRQQIPSRFTCNTRARSPDTGTACGAVTGQGLCGHGLALEEADGPPAARAPSGALLPVFGRLLRRRRDFWRHGRYVTLLSAGRAIPLRDAGVITENQRCSGGVCYVKLCTLRCVALCLRNWEDRRPGCRQPSARGRGSRGRGCRVGRGCRCGRLLSPPSSASCLPACPLDFMGRCVLLLISFTNLFKYLRRDYSWMHIIHH